MSQVKKHTFKELINPRDNTPEKTCALLIAAFGSPQGALNAINYASACIVSAASSLKHMDITNEHQKVILNSYVADIKWQKILANELKAMRDTVSDSDIDEVM